MEFSLWNINVNLKRTKITTISETSFKVFFENILQNNGEGRIDMERLRCSCDIKWLLVSKMDVSHILNNIKCPDGKSIIEVRKLFWNKCINKYLKGWFGFSWEAMSHKQLPTIQSRYSKITKYWYTDNLFLQIIVGEENDGPGS